MQGTEEIFQGIFPWEYFVGVRGPSDISNEKGPFLCERQVPNTRGKRERGVWGRVRVLPQKILRKQHHQVHFRVLHLEKLNSLPDAQPYK